MGDNSKEEKESSTNSRIRTQSECSTNSDDMGPSSSSSAIPACTTPGKRQRTTSHQFMVSSGLTAASPPKFVSLEEIMQAANSMKDMALVHQIVVDDNFKLENVEPQLNSIQKMVKDTMHKAFWDLLRTELAEDPPSYRQAFVLLEDIKQSLFAVLLPQHTKIKEQISEILDAVLLRQQAENGTLEFAKYAQYVISVMAKLCAPIRDEKIKQLTESVDVVETFKGILETLDLMRLDMANFTLAMAKPEIVARSVELERKKFADYLAVQVDGLHNTRKWLLDNVEEDANKHPPPSSAEQYEPYIKSVLKKAFLRACISLLDWAEGVPYPETFMIDETRLRDLQVKTNRLAVVGTVLLTTLSNAGPNLYSIADFKNNLKDHVAILLQSVRDDKDLEQVLPNIAEQVIQDVLETQRKCDLNELDETGRNFLKQQLLQIAAPDHKVKTLVKQRIKEFFQDIIESSTAAPQKVPTGLTALQKEMTAIAGQFLRIVSHNSTVFGIYYYDIISEALPRPSNS